VLTAKAALWGQFNSSLPKWAEAVQAICAKTNYKTIFF